MCTNSLAETESEGSNKEDVSTPYAIVIIGSTVGAAGFVVAFVLIFSVTVVAVIWFRKKKAVTNRYSYYT